MNISPAEIAKRASVSRQAISLWLKEQERRGKLKPAEINGKRKLYDENNPAIKKYIAQTFNRKGSKNKSIPKSKRVKPAPNITPFPEPEEVDTDETGEEYTEAPPPGAMPEEAYSVYETRRMRAWAEKIELENEIKRNQYIKRAFIWQFLGQFTTIFTGIILPMGSKLSSELAAIYACKDPAKILDGQKKIDKETYTAVEVMKKQIDDFLSSVDKPR
jgi:DNA-binding transcriptional MerR regulator